MGRPLRYRAAQVAGWAMLTAVAAILVLIAFADRDACVEPSAEQFGRDSYPQPPCLFVDRTILYEATLTTTIGDIEVVLDPRISPTAVNSFVFLARNGWYDGTVFHRVEVTGEHAFAQAGAANPDGTGTAGYLVDPEDPSPILRYGTGLVAGVTTGDDPPLLTSQFFIVGEDWEAIGPPNAYPVDPPLGKIYDLRSLQVVERLMRLGREDGTPQSVVVVERVTITEIGGEPSPSARDEESSPSATASGAATPRPSPSAS